MRTVSQSECSGIRHEQHITKDPYGDISNSVPESVAPEFRLEGWKGLSSKRSERGRPVVSREIIPEKTECAKVRGWELTQLVRDTKVGSSARKGENEAENIIR